MLVRRWRRLDQPGLELLRLDRFDRLQHARSTMIDAGEDPFALAADWTLDTGWAVQALTLRLQARHGDHELRIERTGPTNWRVNETERPDLDGCMEIDLSAT